MSFAGRSFARTAPENDTQSRQTKPPYKTNRSGQTQKRPPSPAEDLISEEEDRSPDDTLTDDRGNQPKASLWVGNTGSNVTWTEADTKFSTYGHVKSIHIPPNSDYMFVNFNNLRSAIRAFRSLHNTCIFSRLRLNRVRFTDPPAPIIAPQELRTRRMPQGARPSDAKFPISPPLEHSPEQQRLPSDKPSTQDRENPGTEGFPLLGALYNGLAGLGAPDPVRIPSKSRALSPAQHRISDTPLSEVTTSSKASNLGKKCAYCKKPDTPLVSLIPCSKCPRRFHTLCGNPRPQPDDLANFTCGRCLSKQKKSRQTGSVTELSPENHHTEALQAAKQVNLAADRSEHHGLIHGEGVPYIDFSTIGETANSLLLGESACVSPQNDGHSNKSQISPLSTGEIAKDLYSPQLAMLDDTFKQYLHSPRHSISHNTTEEQEPSGRPKGPDTVDNASKSNLKKRNEPAQGDDAIAQISSFVYHEKENKQLHELRDRIPTRPKNWRPPDAWRPHSSTTNLIADRSTFAWAQSVQEKYRQVECPWWNDRDSCIRDAIDCIFAHHETGTRSPNGHQRAKQWTCYDWYTDPDSCKHGPDMCLYAHRDTGLYIGIDGKASRKFQTCFWWFHQQGRCSRKNNCIYAHHWTGIVAEDPATKPGAKSRISRSKGDSWIPEPHLFEQVPRLQANEQVQIERDTRTPGRMNEPSLSTVEQKPERASSPPTSGFGPKMSDIASRVGRLERDHDPRIRNKSLNVADRQLADCDQDEDIEGGTNESKATIPGEQVTSVHSAVLDSQTRDCVRKTSTTNRCISCARIVFRGDKCTSCTSAQQDYESATDKASRHPEWFPTIDQMPEIDAQAVEQIRVEDQDVSGLEANITPKLGKRVASDTSLFPFSKRLKPDLEVTKSKQISKEHTTTQPSQTPEAALASKLNAAVPARTSIATAMITRPAIGRDATELSMPSYSPAVTLGTDIAGGDLTKEPEVARLDLVTPTPDNTHAAAELPRRASLTSEQIDVSVDMSDGESDEPLASRISSKRKRSISLEDTTLPDASDVLDHSQVTGQQLQHSVTVMHPRLTRDASSTHLPTPSSTTESDDISLNYTKVEEAFPGWLKDYAVPDDMVPVEPSCFMFPERKMKAPVPQRLIITNLSRSSLLAFKFTKPHLGPDQFFKLEPAAGYVEKGRAIQVEVSIYPIKRDYRSSLRVDYAYVHKNEVKPAEMPANGFRANKHIPILGTDPISTQMKKRRVPENLDECLEKPNHAQVTDEVDRVVVKSPITLLQKKEQKGIGTVTSQAYWATKLNKTSTPPTVSATATISQPEQRPDCTNPIAEHDMDEDDVPQTDVHRMKSMLLDRPATVRQRSQPNLDKLRGQGVEFEDDVSDNDTDDRGVLPEFGYSSPHFRLQHSGTGERPPDHPPAQANAHLLLPKITKGQGLKGFVKQVGNKLVHTRGEQLIRRRQMSRNLQLHGNAHIGRGRIVPQSQVSALVELSIPNMSDRYASPERELSRENMTFQEFLGAPKDVEFEPCLTGIGKGAQLAFRQMEQDGRLTGLPGRGKSRRVIESDKWPVSNR